ncbi:MAG: hypothetical protein Kow00109_09610 [Acidobacteriota bacterium]
MVVDGFVLAGSTSRRFGCPKALVELHGEPLARRAARILGHVASRVAVVTTHPEWFQPWGLETLADPEPDAGPLAGIVAGLARAAGEWALFLPCDMPLVTPSYLERLASKAALADGAVAADESGSYIPVLGCFRVPACRDVVYRLWAERNRRAAALVENGRLRILTVTPAEAGCGPEVLWDADTPEELQRIADLSRRLGGQLERDLKS